jgi:hypothetical protein
VKMGRHKRHKHSEREELGLSDDEVLLRSRRAGGPERERNMNTKACHEDPETILARSVRTEQGRRKLNFWWNWLNPIPRGGKGAPPCSVSAKSSGEANPLAPTACSC